jgi:AcrR family transcriptional regulator
LDHSERAERPYHHGDLRRAILDAAERRLVEGGPDAVTIRACARDVGVSPAAPIHHFGSLKGLYSALAARGFEQLVARLDADLSARDETGGPVLVGTYVAYAVSAPRMFDLMWRDDLLVEDDADLALARRRALERLRALSDASAPEGDGRMRAIRNWSLAHGLATLLLHGRILKALGDPKTGLATAESFVELARDPAFSG